MKLATIGSTKKRTPVDMFSELLTGQYEEVKGIPCRITKLSPEKTYLSNGIQYCFAEVTFANGVQYGIEAYGDEAARLFAEASSCIRPSSDQSLVGEPLLLTA